MNSKEGIGFDLISFTDMLSNIAVVWDAYILIFPFDVAINVWSTVWVPPFVLLNLASNKVLPIPIWSKNGSPNPAELFVIPVILAVILYFLPCLRVGVISNILVIPLAAKVTLFTVLTLTFRVAGVNCASTNSDSVRGVKFILLYLKEL